MFSDRAEAGRRLASRLRHLRSEPPPLVLGLPRGGVPVALEIARALDAPLDVMVVRKLGAPLQPELGMGAIGEGGVRILDGDIVRLAGATSRELAAVEASERAELERRVRRFRKGRPRQPLAGRTVILVDDGVATGSSARAACRVARVEGAGRVVLAVPVAPADVGRRLVGDTDEIVCLLAPTRFSAIGEFYGDFAQTSDDEVDACLEEAANWRHRPDGSGDATAGSSALLDIWRDVPNL